MTPYHYLQAHTIRLVPCRYTRRYLIGTPPTSKQQPLPPHGSLCGVGSTPESPATRSSLATLAMIAKFIVPVLLVVSIFLLSRPLPRVDARVLRLLEKLQPRNLYHPLYHKNRVRGRTLAESDGPALPPHLGSTAPHHPCPVASDAHAYALRPMCRRCYTLTSLPYCTRAWMEFSL